MLNLVAPQTCPPGYKLRDDPGFYFARAIPATACTSSTQNALSLHHAQLNALIFHNETVLPRTSPGYGEVSLAVAELQGGNYQKAAVLAEIAVGKDPQLAAGWLAKTAADVYEATPDDLRKDRAVFCMDRALECAPSCRAEIIGFFVTNILNHYVEVLCANAAEELGVWTQLEVQANTVNSHAMEARSQATGLTMRSLQMNGDARRLAATGLVTGLTALFTSHRGLQVLGGVASAAALSEADRQQGDAALLDARANALRALGSDMHRAGGELRWAAAQHRTASMLPLVAVRDLIELAARLLRAEGLPSSTLDPLIEHFAGVFQSVLHAHLTWLQQRSLPVFGPHPESQSTVLTLMRIFPGMKHGDIKQLVSPYQPLAPRRGKALPFVGLLFSFFFEVLMVVALCSTLAKLFGVHGSPGERDRGVTLFEVALTSLILFGLDRWRAFSYRRVAGTPAGTRDGASVNYGELLRRGLLGEQATASFKTHPGQGTPPLLPNSTTPFWLQVRRIVRLGTTILRRCSGSVTAIALGVLLFCATPPKSTMRESRRPAASASSGLSEPRQPVETPAPTIRRAIPVSDAPPATLLAPTPASTPVLYEVTGIAAGDTLNVRSGPGVNNEITVRLPNAYRNIQIVGLPVFNGNTPWVQIKFGERTGWVTKSFLKPE